MTPNQLADERIALSEVERSFVVTGAAGGIGAAIVQRLSHDGAVVALDRVMTSSPSGRVRAVIGDAGNDDDATRALAAAEELAPLAGWVNNAAVFEDASLASDGSLRVIEAVTVNLSMAVVGSGTAVRAFRSGGRRGSIVNVSSHQAQRPVRGALPYATAKAAIEGLTRAIAVDHGPDGIRCNAVALGSISTRRYEAYRERDPSVDLEMARLHPLGRVGTPAEVADVVAFLLSDSSAFVSGAIIPVDGGRGALGLDPEATDQ